MEGRVTTRSPVLLDYATRCPRTGRASTVTGLYARRVLVKYRAEDAAAGFTGAAGSGA